jgi:hypothetical protein
MTDPLDLLEVIAGLIQRIEDVERAQTAAPAAPARAAPAAPPNPRWWRRRATEDDWDELRRWVDDLNRNGSVGEQYLIPLCWAEHPGLVEELAAVHQSWRNAMIQQEAGIRTDAGDPATGSVETSMWFTQALWPFLDRLAGGRYLTNRCGVGGREHTDEL